MRSHFRLNSSAATVYAVSGVTAMLSGICSAQIAADSASNPAYAGGWSAGQNGGYGFTPWSFSGTSGTAVQQGMTFGSNPYNALGTTWTLYNPAVSGSSGDLANAGRGFAPLQVGQTLETVIVNPTETHFYRGLTIRLGSGTDNTAVENVAAYYFDYFSYGRWYVGDGSGNKGTSLFLNNTAPGGMELDVTLTSPTTYHLTMTPLGGTASPYSQDGTLKNTGPVDYILFTLYNTQGALPATGPTDLYISSIEIVPEPATLAMVCLGFGGLIFFRRRT
jgi:PEP-CTERM motif